MSTEERTSIDSITMPSQRTMIHAFKFAIKDDKPIMLDYWLGSLSNEASLGKKDTGEFILFKNNEEYTSPLVKTPSRCETDLIVTTENSIYIVSKDISIIHVE